MPSPIVTPDGSEYTVVSSPADPEREPLVLEFDLAPGCVAPPPHVHPANQRETFEVTEGEFELLRGRRWHRLAAGQEMTIEPGEVHTFRNRSGAPVRIRNVHDPAHSFERYLRRVVAIADALGVTRPTPKAALYYSLLWREHRDTIRPAPPLRVPFALMTILARALRLRLPA